MANEWNWDDSLMVLQLQVMHPVSYITRKYLKKLVLRTSGNSEAFMEA